MKIAALSVLLSVVSLGAVAVLALKVDDLADEVRLTRTSRSDASQNRSADSDAFSYPDTRPRGAAEDRTAVDRDDAASATASVESADEQAPASTVEERLARLERDAKRQRSRPTPMFRMPRPMRNLDDLTDHLKLTRSQRDRVQDSLRRANDRIDAIMSVPAADGISPKQARAERMKKLEQALASPEKDHGKILQFAMGGQRRLNEKVPGSNETYAQQIQRVKQETREEVNSGLSAEQQEAFRETNIDGLVGGGGATSMSIITSTTTGAGADGPSAGIVIEAGDAVSVESEDE